jgi:NTE family protein
MKTLVLSGGGSHGAFEAGVIKRLTELGHSWDAIVGVSVGAINALHMAQYKKEDQSKGATDLRQFWHDIKNNDSIYKNWPTGPIESFFGRGSLYDTRPLELFVRQRFDLKKLQSSDILLRMGAVSLGNGEIHFGTEKSPDPVKWMMASSAFPAEFPPIEIDGDKYVDGGIREVTPIRSAISLGSTEMDIVMADPKNAPAGDWDLKKAGNVINVGVRVIGILAGEVFRTDQNCLKGYKGKYHIYAPLAPWDIDALQFNPKDIEHMYDVGYGIP